MRPDLVPGAVFPDYQLPDETGTPFDAIEGEPGSPGKDDGARQVWVRRS